MSTSSSDAEPTVRGPAAGQRVFGRYTLVTILGRGGMGVVWRAHDETLGEDVALKFLPDAVRWDPAAYDDLKAETRRARQLTHPHIVRIHDFVEDAGGAAISMELVEGPTLAQLRLTKERKILEVADIAPWLPQLCAALDYAHTQARVVHRDLKPSNLMLTTAGGLKVADFGVARSLADSVTRVSMMSAGTMVYMSPQQAMGEAPSPADDIYALGATLYELLTGKPPFHTGDVRMQLFQRKPESIVARRRALGVLAAASRAGEGRELEEIPAEWEKMIAACLAKDGAARPVSLGEVAGQLAAAVRPSAPARAWRVGVGNGGRRIFAVALVGAVAVVGWGWWPAGAPTGGSFPRKSRMAPTTRLISQITFDDEVRDDGGQLENVEGVHLMPVHDRHGRVDRAMLFNGNSRVVAEGGPELRWSLRTPFSVACWVRPDVPPKAGSTLVVSDPGVVGAAQWRLELDPSGRPDFTLQVTHLENLQRRAWPVKRALAVGRWHHLVAVSDGAEVRLFVDGALDASDRIADPETPVPARVKISLGGGRQASRNWFVGALDEVRLYRGALTAAEVRALAQDAPARYIATQGIYGENDDLPGILKAEFGPEARLADWLELKAAAGPQVTRLANALALATGDNSYFVARAGQRMFDERRFYNLIRFGGKKPDYYLAHDELGGHELALGSWYGAQLGAIARLALPAPRVERVDLGGPLAAGWKVNDGAIIESRRLVARGGTVALNRDHAVDGETLSTSWRGWLAAGGNSSAQGVEWRDRAGEAWIANCELVAGAPDVYRITLGRRDRPERVVEMRPTFGELVFTLVARPGVLRWRVTTASSGTLVVDERLEVPGWKPADWVGVRWSATAEAGATTWLADVEWREERSK